MRVKEYFKDLFICLLVIGFVFSFCYNASADLSDGLVAYYPFNGNANDESGNGNHGTVSGATLTIDRNGNPDSAYGFDGNDYISLPTAPMPTGTGTIAHWIKFDISTESDQRQMLTYFSNSLDNGWRSGYDILEIHTGINLLNEVKAYYQDGDGSTGCIVLGISALNPNEWYYVVFTYDTSSHTKLFLNGVEAQSKDMTGYVFNDHTPLLCAYLGRTGQGTTRFFNGVMDDVRIYNRVLSESEIQELFIDTTTTTTAFPITTTTTTTYLWNTETVDRRGSVGSSASIALDSSDKVHISYFDWTNGDLKYVTGTSGSWNTPVTVDSNGYVVGHTSIALDSSDRVHISYFDDINYDLKYVTGTSGSWNTPERLDSKGSVGWFPSIALDSSDRVHISYCHSYYANHDLKYVTGTSGSWNTPETLDSRGRVGMYTSIALDSSDKVHISYYDNRNGDLKYATQQAKPTTTIGIDFVTLLPGQYAEFLTNQTNSFGSHSVVVMSLGNKKLTGKLTPVTEDINGLGWISLLGTGTGGNWFDLSYGFFPLDGIDVEIDLNQWLNFAIATGSVIATSPVSAENPIEYKIKVSGTATE